MLDDGDVHIHAERPPIAQIVLKESATFDDMYYASYPGVKGVFFDEMTNGYEESRNDTLPNPWDTVPSYFSTLIAGLN